MRSILRQLGLTLIVVLISAAALAAPRTYSLSIEGLACPLCAYSVKRNLSAIEGVEEVEIDHKTGEALVTMAEGASLDEAAARAAIVSAGFKLRAFEEVQSASQK